MLNVHFSRLRSYSGLVSLSVCFINTVCAEFGPPVSSGTLSVLECLKTVRRTKHWLYLFIHESIQLYEALHCECTELYEQLQAIK